MKSNTVKIKNLCECKVLYYIFLLIYINLLYIESFSG